MVLLTNISANPRFVWLDGKPHAVRPGQTIEVPEDAVSQEVVKENPRWWRVEELTKKIAEAGEGGAQAAAQPTGAGVGQGEAPGNVDPGTSQSRPKPRGRRPRSGGSR